MKGKNRRLGYTLPTKSPEKKAKEAYDKERLKRKKCRDKNSDTDMCKHCSMAQLCSSEATEDYLNSKKEGE